MLRVFCFGQLVYPSIIQSAFGVFACKTLADGSSTFSFAPHLDCDSDEARVARIVAAASLAIWGVGFPLFLGALVQRFSSDPKFSFVIVSYGYKPTLRFWEAWECLKKFFILLIITFLRSSPEVAATSLLLFLCFALMVSAVSEPFISSLVNKAHLACDLFIIFVLLTGLLSNGVGLMWREEVENQAIAVVSYATCLLAGFAALLWLETGSIFQKGGKRQALWDRFLISSHDVLVSNVNAVKRLSITGFSAAVIVPEPAITHAEHTAVQVSSAAAAEASASPNLPALSTNNRLA